MNTTKKLIYEGKAKKIFAHEDPKKVIIEFKDDATAFNALKRSKFEGKGELNCVISQNIFKHLMKNNIPTHYLDSISKNCFIAQKIDIVPIEVVLRNIAYGSICKQTNVKPGTVLESPLIDFYFKDDELNDPLLTIERIKLMNLISLGELNLIKDLTLKINSILINFFLDIQLKLVDFKVEFGRNSMGEIVLADEFSPDNCRLWDLKANNGKIVSLDKDRFRHDLGDLIEAYSEINNRIKNFISST
tara:strand:+ start:884 stop:1621 length:738 start_codon:yes stop_codon:yes gene_type:complete